MRTYLQLLQPVFTFGLLVLLRFGLSWGPGEVESSEDGEGGVPFGVWTGRARDTEVIARVFACGERSVSRSRPTGDQNSPEADGTRH